MTPLALVFLQLVLSPCLVFCLRDVFAAVATVNCQQLMTHELTCPFFQATAKAQVLESMARIATAKATASTMCDACLNPKKRKKHDIDCPRHRSGKPSAKQRKIMPDPQTRLDWDVMGDMLKRAPKAVQSTFRSLKTRFDDAKAKCDWTTVGSLHLQAETLARENNMPSSVKDEAFVLVSQAAELLKPTEKPANTWSRIEAVAVCYKAQRCCRCAG